MKSVCMHLCQTQTCDGFEGVCGIALACSEGVVCDSAAAPRGEWERKELRVGRSLNLTWTAGKDAAFLGLGCLPSGHRGEGGEETTNVRLEGKKKKKKVRTIRERMNKKESTMKYKFYLNQKKSKENRRWSCFILTLSRSSLHTLSE